MWNIRAFQHPCYWHSYAMIFFFRLQPGLERRIENNVQAALDTLPGFNPARAIGMPIRGSDKCRGYSLAESAHGEMDCIPLGYLLLIYCLHFVVSKKVTIFANFWFFSI